MLFNTFLFWTFFVAVWVTYVKLDRRGQNWLLLGASYLFYGVWDWRFLSLIWLSTILDFLIARGMERESAPRRRKALLAASITTNLGLLGFFKYFNFFAAEFASFISFFGLEAHQPTLQIILPVGISFYTFQTLSYTVDVYRREIEAERSLRDFALYVAFFPQLVAGPIERAQRLLPQFSSVRKVTREDLKLGTYDILYGLLLKVAIADNMAPLANAVFGTAGYTGGDTLIGVYAFAFQIYGDFAGYSFMARGLARCLGIDIMLNFRRPYFAVNPSDFWKRWHISLSSWLRDYLYIPLGGNRGGSYKTYRNLFLTMLIGGLWHGASWTFVVWGALHGLLLIGFRLWDGQKSRRSLAVVADGAPRVADSASGSVWRQGQQLVQVILFFHAICLTWIFFRAESVSTAFAIISAIATDLTFSTFALGAASTITLFVAPLMAYELWLERTGDHARLLNERWWSRGLAYAYCIFMIVFFPPLDPQQFIYFQF